MQSVRAGCETVRRPDRRTIGLLAALIVAFLLGGAVPASADGQSYSFSGTGTRAVGPFSLSTGLSVFEITTSDTDAYFGVELMSSSGGYVDLLANTVGTYDGSKATEIERSGYYYINVDSECAWEINVTQPRPTSAPSTRSFSGQTQAATSIFYLPAGPRRMSWTHSGSGYFGVVLMDRYGRWVDLVANQIGSSSGSVIIDVPASGLYLFDVDAEDPWTIRIQVPTVLSISAPTTVKFGSAATVTGTLKTTGGSALAGRQVRLQISKDGSSWSDHRSTTTDSSGRYSMTTTGLTAARKFRVKHSATNAYGSATSSQRTVKPKIHFSSAPRFSTYTHTYGKTYTVWGYIKPKHTTGSTQIKVKAYRKEKQSDGTYKYVWKKTYSTTISNPSGSTYSKYKGYAKLPYKGKWRLRAYHAADSRNATTYSSYRYVEVK